MTAAQFLPQVALEYLADGIVRQLVAQFQPFRQLAVPPISPFVGAWMAFMPVQCSG